MTGRGVVLTEFRAAILAVDRGLVLWSPAIRAAVMVVIAECSFIYLGAAVVAIPVVLAMVFVAWTDPMGADINRAKIMLWATVWMAAGATLGGLVADHLILHIVVAVIVAAICGFVTAGGEWTGLIGVLGLVMFAIFSGTEVTLDSDLTNGALVLVGGLLMTASALLMWPSRRTYGVRADIAIAYRSLAAAIEARTAGALSAEPARRFRIAAGEVRAGGAFGYSARWLCDLIKAGEEARLLILSLHEAVDAAAQPDVSPEFPAFTAAVAELCEQIASSLTGRRSRDFTARMAALDAALESWGAFLGGSPPRGASAVRDRLVGATALLSQPWPLGRDADMRLRGPSDLVLRPAVVRHVAISNPHFRHGARLAIAFLVATTISELLQVPHRYWFPVVVAFVAMPDVARTSAKVVARVLGTYAGLAFVAALVLGFSPGPYVLAVAIGLAAVLSIAFIRANYAISVSGIAAIVVLLLVVAGEPVTEDIALLAVMTTAAGALVLIVTYAWPGKATNLMAEQ